MRAERPLRLGLDRREIAVGSPVTVVVRDRGNKPIEGATIVAGTKRKRTDSNGRCELTFRSPGFWKIVAARAPTDRVAYEPASTVVRVVPRTSSGGSTKYVA
ncbi:carboxypeptidase regulatory-like domain-containing protein [Natrialbaceae archaeon A-arb3/5]